jgi:hypothetical protein
MKSVNFQVVNYHSVYLTTSLFAKLDMEHQTYLEKKTPLQMKEGLHIQTRFLSLPLNAPLLWM